MQYKMRVVISIAGFDPSGGAGILADIKTFEAFGCFDIAAVKIGMLPTREAIEVVAEIIERKRLPNVVLDPVIRSTSGYDLIDDAAAGFLAARLLPLADIVTPNMVEAERLTGLTVTDLD